MNFLVYAVLLHTIPVHPGLVSLKTEVEWEQFGILNYFLPCLFSSVALHGEVPGLTEAMLCEIQSSLALDQFALVAS